MVFACVLPVCFELVLFFDLFCLCCLFWFVCSWFLFVSVDRTWLLLSVCLVFLFDGCCLLIFPWFALFGVA